MDNHIQHKLFNYEAVPPEHAWENIAAATDPLSLTIAKKLDTYEAAPPANAWTRIENQLHAIKENSTPVRSIKTPYMAVAALFVLIAGAIFLLTNKGTDDSIAQQKSGTPVAEKQTVTSPDTNVTLITDNETGDNKQNTESRSVTAKSKQRKADVTTTKEDQSATDKKDTGSSRYMTLASNSGQVRLSKKVLPAYDCSLATTATALAKCKENLQTLQMKMATSLTSPATDFAGLMDMLKTLEENR